MAEWSHAVNLVAGSQLGHLWERHILDSAQLLPLGAGAKTWLDLGSGGGFPGAVLAILLADVPQSCISLVESNRRKAAFLQTALHECAHARIHAVRIEEAALLVAAPQVITARALAPLNRLLELVHPWWSDDVRALFPKGRGFRAEFEQANGSWLFDLIEHASKSEPEAVILEIRRLRRRR